MNATTNRLTLETVGDREFTAERIFDAPRDRVFAAYTDPELIGQWWGPEGAETTVDYADFTTGGRWRFVVRGPDGNEMAFQGAFREVTPPERIVQTFEFEGAAGHVSVDEATFEDLGDGRTRMHVHSIFHTAQERDETLASGMEQGFGETLDRFERLLLS